MNLAFINGLDAALWIIFIGYWAVSAFNVKKNVRGGNAWWGWFLSRIVLIVAIVWAFGSFGAFFKAVKALPIGGSPAAAVVGLVLVALGIAFAIWARMHLGRNWSGTPSIKKDHELVTSGPYRFVRHPIYTGIILALIGNVLAEGWPWIAALIIFAIIFLFRIPKEEGFMMQLFPDQYPEYRKHTRALIPFVW